MPRQKKALTKEEKLAKDRIRKQNKYAEIKNNPELYAIQKEKERRRYILRKEKKKINSITDMTPRGQREQRKRWRRNSKNYLNKKKEQKRIENILLNNSPPESDEEVQNIEVYMQDPLESPREEKGNVRTCHSVKSSSLIRKIRYRHQKVVKKLQEEIVKLKKQKKNLSRKAQVQKKVNIEDTIEKKVNELVTDIRTEKVEEVKKRLLFNETLTLDMTQGYKSLKKKEKRIFADTVIKSKEKLRRYKILNQVPFRLRDNIMQRKPNLIKQKIQLFFEEDTNSRVAAGKKECVKRNGIKKQKRYVTDNLKNLHDKFLKEQCQVSYSTFCKYRPYWVVSPDNNRDTCLCKLHSNVDLLMKALKKGKITNEGSGSEMIKSLSCDSHNHRIDSNKCLERTCELCKNKVLKFLEFRNDEKLTYYEWVIEKQKYTDRNGKANLKTISTKKKFDGYPLNIILKLDAIQNTYFKHCYNIAMQYSAIKELKNNLNSNEILIHIDFSENYYLKYHEEIQSFHFGGSRGQVSLHTGVFYYLDEPTGSLLNKSFCTLSQNTNHDAGSIWAHLTPILKLIQDIIPHVTTIHFLSDSPSSQYRNKFIFYLITKLKDEVKKLNKITWNYQEAGHGKGAPDGVGAVIKRTADNFVKYGGDVGSFGAFVEIIKSNIRNIHIEIVDEEEVAKMRFPSNIPGFKGTMKVHQVVWCLSLPHSIALRSLSCFACNDNYTPCRHNRHLGNWSVAVDKDNESITSQDYYLHLDSPTFINNIKDINAVENEILFDENLIPTVDIIKRPHTPKVKILSDVRISWENRSFYKKPSEVFNPHDQRGFESFIQVRSENLKELPNTMSDVDNIICENSNKENFDVEVNQPYHTSLKHINNVNYKYNVNDWVIAQYQIKRKLYAYIGKIRDHSNGMYNVIFLKKIQGKSLKFCWPDVSDEDIIVESRFIIIEEPITNRRGQYIFNNLPDYNYK